MPDQHPLSESEFWQIYRKVPRLCVEILLQRDGRTYLTLRDIEPCKGLWHLPGGTVRFGERLLEAVRRIARRELNIDVREAGLRGTIEYPSHFENGLDSPVGIVFAVQSFEGTVTPNQEASRGDWFAELPANMHEEQRQFLVAPKDGIDM